MIGYDAFPAVTIDDGPGSGTTFHPAQDLSGYIGC